MNKKTIFPSQPPITGGMFPLLPKVYPISIMKKKTRTIPSVILKLMTSAFLNGMLPSVRPMMITRNRVTEYAIFLLYFVMSPL